MEEKKTNLLKLFAFIIVLIALIVYYIAQKNEKSGLDAAVEPLPSATAEVLVPPVVSGSSSTSEDNTGQQSSTKSDNKEGKPEAAASDGQVDVSAKADTYYDNLDNFQPENNSTNAEGQENPEVEVKDGIEIITNPKNGVQ